MTDARIIKSTADLTPDGLLGYAKGIAAFATLLGTALAAIVPYLNPDSHWAQWVGLTIAVCGAVATVAVPNKVKPVVVDPGPIIPPGPPVDPGL